MKSIPERKVILGLLSLTSLGAAIFLPDTYLQLDRREGQAWPYGVIGDSCGSGVSYNKNSLYDNNKHNGLTKECHDPQVEADNIWIGHDLSGLRDTTCSGSNLEDIVLGQHPMEKVANPDVVIITSGGNMVGFGNVVDVCIYHFDIRHYYYGNPYEDDPDRMGDHAQALDSALSTSQMLPPSLALLPEILLHPALRLLLLP